MEDHTGFGESVLMARFERGLEEETRLHQIQTGLAFTGKTMRKERIPPMVFKKKIQPNTHPLFLVAFG